MNAKSSEERWKVKVGEFGTTSVALQRSEAAPNGRTVIIAPSSGGSMDYKTTLNLAAIFLERGFNVGRFNFLYQELKTGPPDRMPKLIACYSAVVEQLRSEISPGVLLLGGHSMGGRVATTMASEGFSADGLIPLAYPLHPGGQPEKLRDTHLHSITQPVLCLNGTRDDLCTQELMNSVVSKLNANWTMHWLEGADHSFHVLKRSGRTEQDVFQEIGDTARDWAKRIFG